MIKGWGVTTSNVRASIAYYSRVADQAERYYREQQDHALGEDQEVGESPTLLYGAADVLAALELEEGEVETRVVTALAGGVHPATAEVLVEGRRGIDPKTGEPWARRCYYDFALSVPQSYSTAFAAALTTGDAATADAMRQDLIDAAVASYRAMESILALGRRDAGGATKVEVHAPFLANLHTSSRPVSGRTHGDPTLHVHLRVMNMGVGIDGKWGAIDYGPLWSAVRTWSALFEADLQVRIHRRGGQTTLVQRGARRPWTSWELAHRNVALDEVFSTRSTVVSVLEASLWERNAAELLTRIRADDVAAGEKPRTNLTARQWEAVRPRAKQIDAEVRRTREKKALTTRTQLLDEWRHQVENHGYAQPTYDAVDRRFGVDARLPRRLRELVQARAREGAVEQITSDLLAPTGLTASAAVWTRPELAEALSAKLVTSELGVHDAADIIRRVESRAVRCPNTLAGQPVWTTAELLTCEREWSGYLTELARSARRLRVPPGAIEGAEAEAVRAQNRGVGTGLDHEQSAAVRSALSGPGFAAIIGDAGSGKTTTARVIVDALRRAGYSPIGLAMAGSASQVLGDSARLPCWNVRDFLTRHRHGALGHPVGWRTVVLLDEAGTVDDRTLAELTRLLKVAKVAAVIAIGDDRQTQPVGAGAPLSWVRQNLPERVSRLTTNYRQGEHQGDPRAARSSLLRYGDGRAYLQALDHTGHLIVTRTTDDAIRDLTHRWRDVLRAGGDVREHVGICNLNALRDQVNDAFRSAYASLGRLGDEVILPGGRVVAVGDRVAFRGPFRELLLNSEGQPVRSRRAGQEPAQPGKRTTGRRVPNRARATVAAVDAARSLVVVATDPTDERPSTTLTLRACEAARLLEYAYCLTTHIAQGVTITAAYSMADVSHVADTATAYVRATRECHDGWLAVSAESARVDPLRDDWQAATAAALADATSRPASARCALDYVGGEVLDIDKGEAAHRESRNRDDALRTLLASPMLRQVAALEATGRVPDQNTRFAGARLATTRAVTLRAELEERLFAALAPRYGDERARRWAREAMRASGLASAACSEPTNQLDESAAEHRHHRALSAPATARQLQQLVDCGITVADAKRWTWARASVRPDLARGAAVPEEGVLRWLCTRGLHPGRAASEVNRLLADYGVRLDLAVPHPSQVGRPLRMRYLTAPDEERLEQIRRLLNSPPGIARLDAVHDYKQWRAERRQGKMASPSGGHQRELLE